MTARWSLLGAYEPRAGATEGEAPRPGSVFREAWRATLPTQLALATAISATTTHYFIDHAIEIRQDYTVIADTDGPRVIRR